MDIGAIVLWIQTNWGEVIRIWLEVIGVASIVVKWTPTLKDDDALKWLIKFVGKYLALNRGSTTT